MNDYLLAAAGLAFVAIVLSLGLWAIGVMR